MLDILAIDLVGVVPNDDSVVVSTNRGEPLTLGMQSPACKAFDNIGLRLTGEEVPFLDIEKFGEKGLVGTLRKMFGF